MRERVSHKLFWVGVTIFILSYLLPLDLFSAYTNLKPTGLTTLFICPLIGFIGVIYAIVDRDRLYIVLNTLLILLFPIGMLLGHLVGP